MNNTSLKCYHFYTSNINKNMKAKIHSIYKNAADDEVRIAYAEYEGDMLILRGHYDVSKDEFINKYCEKSEPTEINDKTELIKLVDDAYIIVEAHFNPDPDDSFNRRWKEKWLEKARKLVPGCGHL